MQTVRLVLAAMVAVFLAGCDSIQMTVENSHNTEVLQIDVDVYLQFYLNAPDPGSSANLYSAGEGVTCANFEAQSQAQALYEANGGPSGNPFGPDKDGDGFVCEWLP